MLAGYLLQTLERHSDELTDALIRDLTTNERTPSFRSLEREALHERARAIYRRMVDWLSARSEWQLDATFEALGRQRYGEHVPLDELVYALTLTKHHLRDRIVRLGEIQSAIELHYEMDLHTMIGQFFDRAVYAMVKGYEQARSAAPPGERPEAWAKFGVATSSRVGGWVP